MNGQQPDVVARHHNLIIIGAAVPDPEASLRRIWELVAWQPPEGQARQIHVMFDQARSLRANSRLARDMLVRAGIFVHTF